MDNSPDLRPALAYLKCVAEDDREGIRVLTEHGDLLDLVAALGDLVFLFITGVTDNPSAHVDLMFAAFEHAQRGIQE